MQRKENEMNDLRSDDVRQTPAAIAMGRPVAALVGDCRGDGDAASVAICEAAYAWAEARVADVLPAGFHADMVVELLGGLSACFQDVAAFDERATQLHAWLSAIGSRDDMTSLSSLRDHAANLGLAAHSFEEGTTITVELENALVAMAVTVENRCTFVIDDFLPAFDCHVGIYQDEFVADVMPQGGDRVVVGSASMETPRQGPTRISGPLVGNAVTGRVRVLSTVVSGSRTVLSVEIRDDAADRVYGPLEVSDRSLLGLFLSGDGRRHRLACNVAQPVEPGRDPVVVLCDHVVEPPR